ncbi:putative ankyrin repeat protein RF_0381 [Phymastichus coffea]|uniref:putative ankyrin repeat protein RF_0381 n=1 Tax=Phymastichus coffea TaxID=108790 RepID=UPI00273C8CD5|nr:putative ankyrin repeat protein RF_0381 [Phymastichus coffea]XP_058793537.1 putative ankyrin repeat protein RF_0381 [Phymastichus coffea]XP_058793538.1 putative ankyrin repeat protein RF_0381 [Phymastichus coffea]XP_058793539.1 putative ankyrin repeat protein RF_0381 [Phymastichus coffea]XP_058802511.1 putative ankyrin repeat protein RF_0381 [Phymastichus coffea]XP_058802512.1 putative ankyrin repeat protein RF_0381 [Phymastichus coffea]XP_058802513.1 putative ankyrin repeat protein RF_038
MAAKFMFPKKLLQHIERGRNEEAKEMLNEDLAKGRDDFGTLLHYAARYGNAAIAPTLIELGSDIEARGSGNLTPLTVAVLLERTELCAMLLAAGARVNIYDDETMMQKIFNEPDTCCDLITLFLEAVVCPLKQTIGEIVEFFIYYSSSMYHATCVGQISVLEEMVRMGYELDSINRAGKTALHAAAQLGDLCLGKWLVVQGVDVNVIDHSGYTALCAAARSGDEEMIKMLMQQGADPNQQSPTYRITPLYETFLDIKPDISEQYDACAECLLQSGAIPCNPCIVETVDDPKTIFDFAFERSNYNRLRMVICHLAVYEQRGFSIAKSVMYCLCPQYQERLDDQKFYYKSCHRVLQTNMFGKYSLLDLLTKDEFTMKKMIRDETFSRKVTEMSTELCLEKLYTYYYNTLFARIKRYEKIILLDDASEQFSGITLRETAC